MEWLMVLQLLGLRKLSNVKQYQLANINLNENTNMSELNTKNVEDAKRSIEQVVITRIPAKPNHVKDKEPKILPEVTNQVERVVR